jgi:hypothetical protein
MLYKVQLQLLFNIDQLDKAEEYCQKILKGTDQM